MPPDPPPPPELPQAPPPPPPRRIPDSVFRSVDARLVLSPDAGAPAHEMSAASDVIEGYELMSYVGRLTGVKIRVSSALRPFYELGNRFPTDLRPGTVRITGMAERAHINGALIRLLLADWAKPGGKTFLAPPAFNLVVYLAADDNPGQYTQVVLHGTRLDGWDYSIPSDDFVMERVSFQALRIEFEEA